MKFGLRLGNALSDIVFRVTVSVPLFAASKENSRPLL